MRQQGQAQLGYFPTPDVLIPVIRSWWRAPAASWAALDPTCGTGAALAATGAPRTWGVEIEDHRAAAAQAILTAVLHGGFEDTTISPHSVSLLWFNPPYGHDPLNGGRLETTFVNLATPLLVPHGLLVALVPVDALSSIESHLQSEYDVRLVRRFPSPLYQPYRQVVILATRRAVSRSAPWEAPRLDTWRTDPIPPEDRPASDRYLTTSFPVLTARPDTESPIPLPPSPGPARFALRPLRPAALYATLSQQDGAFATLRRMTTPAPPLSEAHPIATPLTLHQGHLATLLAAGLLRGAIGTGDARHLVRGRVLTTDDVTIDDSDPDRVREIHHTRHTIELLTLSATGTLTTWGAATSPDPEVSDVPA